MAETADVAGVFAQPFTFHPERWTYILDKVCDHRPWFNDNIWNDPEARRIAASKYLVDAASNGFLWEVFDGKSLTGILLLNNVDFNSSAQCHFVFFDHKLANKRQLCLNAMAWAFENFKLETLRLEVPTYARALAKWARRKLGFRYETEARKLARTNVRLEPKEAEIGARKFRATLYEGQWEDALLLSITKEEFFSHHGRTQDRESGCINGSNGRLTAAGGAVLQEVPSQPSDGDGTVHDTPPTATE